jgi:hypothetical protein
MTTQSPQMIVGSCYTIYPLYSVRNRNTYDFNREIGSVEYYFGTFVSEEGDNYLFDNVKFIQI